MSKEERHSEIIKRLDTLSFRLNEIVQALNNLQHPEKSAFGLPLDPDLRPAKSFYPNQMAQESINPPDVKGQGFSQ